MVWCIPRVHCCFWLLLHGILGCHPQGAQRVQELWDGGAQGEPHLYPVSPAQRAPRRAPPWEARLISTGFSYSHPRAHSAVSYIVNKAMKIVMFRNLLFFILGLGFVATIVFCCSANYSILVQSNKTRHSWFICNPDWLIVIGSAWRVSSHLALLPIGLFVVIHGLKSMFWVSCVKMR